MIRNTAADMNDPLNSMMFLLDGMGPAGPSGAIERMEKRGQTELVHSDRLPAEINHGAQADFEAVGFTFGEPDASDPLFRPATLPKGWTKQPSDHDMWSYVVDQLGRRRVAIFYKAAFYDRRAHMNLTSVQGYVTDFAWGGADVITDDEWATPEAVVDAAQKAITQETDNLRYPSDRLRDGTAERIACLEALVAEHTA
jgi:hypothetical protein